MVCNITVAVDRTYGEETDFFRAQAWGKTAELIEKFFTKGREILLRGTMENNPYENKETGKKVPFWQLRVDQFDFCGSKKDGTEKAGKSRDPNIPEGFEPLEDDDSIPF
jgi:single-strand DNA-binding protein